MAVSTAALIGPGGARRARERMKLSTSSLFQIEFEEHTCGSVRARGPCCGYEFLHVRLQAV
jgi:hypothetical protein